MPQLNPESFASQLFWLVAGFTFLYAVLSLLILPRIRGTIEQRESSIQADLELAQQLKDEAEHAMQTYENALQGARVEAVKTAQQIHKDMQAEAQQKKAELDAQLANQMAEAEQRLSQLQADAMANVETAAKDIIADIVAATSGIVVEEAAITAALEKQKRA